MKKELLIGTALVSTLGAASVAEAVTATMSGNHQTGIRFNSPTAGDDTRAQVNDNNFTVSLEETTDGGMTISSSFMLMNEAGGGSSDEDAGFSLAFTDGSKLDVINAGNASGSHAISVPGSAGAESVTVTTSNKAPTGLDFAAGSTVYGVEYHTADDFLADGLSMSFSLSTGDGANKTSTLKNDGHYAIGGFDTFMAYSGFMQALARHQEVPEYRGMFLIATGFLLKSIYNLQSAKIDDKNRLFWTNFIAYNLLVFSGYYITENFGVE